jgi:thioredoxin reductase
MKAFDVIVVGGGPAGLSATLILGRCGRRVLLCDDGRPRNAVSRGVHGFLSRDGIPPARLRAAALGELRRYPSVRTLAVTVTGGRRLERGFVLEAGRRRFHGRKVLLATGVVDRLPRVKGVEALYGKSVFHCPYCDGWENRGQPLAVYGKGSRGVKLARTLTRWSRDLVLCTDGPSLLSPRDRAVLDRLGIPVREERIAELEARGGRLRALRFRDGGRLPRRVLFFNTGSRLRTDLMRHLGCEFSPNRGVPVGRYAVTGVPGLYVAGNPTRDVQLAIVAAAEGAKAAYGINTALTEEDCAI